MSTIAVVIPTIAGREDHYARCVEAYQAHSQHEGFIITIRDLPTCGQAWNDGATLAALGTSKGITSPHVVPDYIHFTADDLEPHKGWDIAAVEAVEQGVLPAPRLTRADGTLDYCGEHGQDLADWTPVQMSVVPFMSWAQWLKIGPSLPIHYFSDNYLSWRGLQAGYPTVVRRGFAFTHHWAQPGRGAGMTYEQRMARDRVEFMAAIQGAAVGV